MPENGADEIARLAAELREQLAFLRDIGITDIGGSMRQPSEAEGPPTLRLQTPDSRLNAPLEQAAWVKDVPLDGTTDGPMVVEQPQSSAPQFNLFGEIVSPPTNVKAKPSTAQTTGSIDLPTDRSLAEIRSDLGDCSRCRLHQYRTNIVFGEGNPAAQLVFVGEGPGAEEDRTGRPFVGKAGKLLDKIIEAIGLSRADVYIANVVKCRPPDNRTPEPDEAATCGPFLFRQLGFIRPKAIVALGAPALKCLTGSNEGITKARGHWQQWHGIKVMPTYHPAYLLRVPDKKKETWEDMKKVRDYIVTGDGLP